MRCEDCLPLIEEFADGELEGREGERVAAHLSTCASCGEELDGLRREQELYALYRRDVSVTPADWDALRARIELEGGGRALRPRLADWFAGIFGPHNPFRSALVAALIIIVVGVTAVAIYMNSSGGRDGLASRPAGVEEKGAPPAIITEPSRPAAADVGNHASVRDESRNDSDRRTEVARAGSTGRKERRAQAAAARTRQEGRPAYGMTPAESAQLYEPAQAFFMPASARRPAAGEAGGGPDFEVSRHAERTELLLRSFRNVRPQSSARPLDISYEREQSRKLLYQNIALRRDAAERGDRSSVELLNTLEPILLDIANLPERARARDLRPIERRMEKKEIVAALRVRTLIASN